MVRVQRRAIRGIVTCALVLSATRSARAQDPFEIQVYDGTADSPGVPGLELHLNDWVTGHRDAESPSAPLHGQFHATLEPSLGILPFWEIGAYLQFAVREDDAAADWAGAKLRSKFVTPPSWDAKWRLGVNVEASYLPATYDAGRWGGEVRPIVAWADGRWLVAVNPILEQTFGSAGSRGPAFEPAIKAAGTIGPVALGFEYYAGLGPLVAPLPLRQQTHEVFEVVDVVSVHGLEVNFGVGEGLTAASAGIIVKAIVGYAFERPERADGATRGGPSSDLRPKIGGPFLKSVATSGPNAGITRPMP